MGTKRKPHPHRYLLHLETGQRYPLAGDVLIGRAQGDILFPEDDTVSGKHVRIFPTGRGYGIQDLDSHGGTVVNGKRLTPRQLYALDVNSTILVGHQALKLQSPEYPRKSKRRRKSEMDWLTLSAGLLVLGGGGLLTAQVLNSPLLKRQPAGQMLVESPFQKIDREMSALVQMWKTAPAGSPPLTAQAQDLLARFQLLRGDSEWERRKLEANQRFLQALVQGWPPEQLVQSLADMERLDKSRRPGYFDY